MAVFYHFLLLKVLRKEGNFVAKHHAYKRLRDYFQHLANWHLISI